MNKLNYPKNQFIQKLKKGYVLIKILKMHLFSKSGTYQLRTKNCLKCSFSKNKCDCKKIRSFENFRKTIYLKNSLKNEIDFKTSISITEIDKKMKKFKKINHSNECHVIKNEIFCKKCYQNYKNKQKCLKCSKIH